VALETACEIFFDPFICLLRTEAVGEERELAIGMTRGWKLLVAVYTFRADFIRLISARPATSPERRAYEDGQAS
jgi:uncharacterized DUF497 family protein